MGWSSQPETHESTQGMRRRRSHPRGFSGIDRLYRSHPRGSTVSGPFCRHCWLEVGLAPGGFKDGDIIANEHLGFGITKT